MQCLQLLCDVAVFVNCFRLFVKMFWEENWGGGVWLIMCGINNLGILGQFKILNDDCFGDKGNYCCIIPWQYWQ